MQQEKRRGKGIKSNVGDSGAKRGGKAFPINNDFALLQRKNN